MSFYNSTIDFRSGNLISMTNMWASKIHSKMEL